MRARGFRSAGRVLKRNVPRWLAEPELAAIVVGFTEAAVSHGGEGALYVHLRKRAPVSATTVELARRARLRPRVRRIPRLVSGVQ